MAELRGLAMEYEMPIPKSVQEAAEKVGLGQLHTKIKVRLTKKKKSSRAITVYSVHPALGNFPTLLLGILLPLPILPILAAFSSEVQTLPPNIILQRLDHQIRCHEKGLMRSSRRGFGYTQIPG